MAGERSSGVSYDDPYGAGGARAYVRGRWYSPWVAPGFAFKELIASYNARTPVGTFIEISVRGRSGGRHVVVGLPRSLGEPRQGLPPDVAWRRSPTTSGGSVSTPG